MIFPPTRRTRRKTIITGPLLGSLAVYRTASEYQPPQTSFQRRNSAMKRGLVQTRVLHSGHLSKRRQDGRTRGFRMSLTSRLVFASFLRAAARVPCCLLRELPETPVEVDVLADPRPLVVSPDLLEDVPPAELRGALHHPHEVAQEPPGPQVEPGEKTLRPVFDVHATPDAGRVSRHRVYGLEERTRNDHVRVDEDEHVALCMARARVPRPRNPLHRLADHRRALAGSDGSSLIRAVVVDDDNLDVDAGAVTQMRLGCSNRIKRRPKVGLFVGRRNDDREPQENPLWSGQHLTDVIRLSKPWALHVCLGYTCCHSSSFPCMGAAGGGFTKRRSVSEGKAPRFFLVLLSTISEDSRSMLASRRFRWLEWNSILSE